MAREIRTHTLIFIAESTWYLGSINELPEELFEFKGNSLCNLSTQVTGTWI